MAEGLEEPSNSADTDRNLDSCAFQNRLFDIFTHDYREYGVVNECDPEDVNHEKCRDLHEKRTNAKKQAVNAGRRLQKALIYLRNLPSNSAIFPMIDEIQRLADEIRKSIVSDSEEFKATTVTLPDFDPIDMELLLGKDQVPPTLSMLEAVEKNRQATETALEGLIAQADIMLNEYEEVKRTVERREKSIN